MVKGVSREGQKRLEGEEKSTYFRGGDEESASARGKVGGSQSEGGSFHVNSSKSQSNLVGHGRGVGGDVGGRDRLSLGFLNGGPGRWILG